MTAPVAPMEARCEHCHDTGSLSKELDGPLDCYYCEATNQRIAMRNHIAQFTGWPENDTGAWAAYLFAQRQAAPVAQPALPKLPSTPLEVSRFIGTNFDSMETAVDLEDVKLVVSIHDLLSCFQNLADFAEEQPAQQVEAVEEVEQLKARLEAKETRNKMLLTELDALGARYFHDGIPPAHFGKEWFIAVMDDGDKVVLRALGEENAYDYTTMDATYFKAYRVKKWMQFPDSHYITYQGAAPQLEAQQAGDVAQGLTSEIKRMTNNAILLLSDENLSSRDIVVHVVHLAIDAAIAQGGKA